MYKQYAGLLEKTPLFLDINKEELPRILNCISPVIEGYERNDLIALNNQTINGVYVILSGIVTLLKETVKGNNLILAKLEAGEMFGETAAFSDSHVWPVTVVADTQCYLMRIPVNKIVGMCSQRCDNHKRLLMNMLRILADKAIMLNKRIEYLSLGDLRSRICVFLYNIYKKEGNLIFDLPYNRDELAQYLGVTRPSLSRELSKMKDDNIIEYYKSSVKILDIERLIDSIS